MDAISLTVAQRPVKAARHVGPRWSSGPCSRSQRRASSVRRDRPRGRAPRTPGSGRAAGGGTPRAPPRSPARAPAPAGAARSTRGGPGGEQLPQRERGSRTVTRPRGAPQRARERARALGQQRARLAAVPALHGRVEVGRAGRACPRRATAPSRPHAGAPALAGPHHQQELAVEQGEPVAAASGGGGGARRPRCSSTQPREERRKASTCARGVRGGIVRRTPEGADPERHAPRPAVAHEGVGIGLVAVLHRGERLVATIARMPGRGRDLDAAGDRRSAGPIGAWARLGLAELMPTEPGRWPWGTFTANIAGCAAARLRRARA